MIGKSITKRTAMLCSLLAVLTLIALYSVLSHMHHRQNPNDRTFPTWVQLWQGVVYLCQKPDTSPAQASSLLAAALAAGGMESSQPLGKEGFLQGRILWEASKATLGRLFSGLSIGLIGGIIIGVIMGCFLKFDASVSPIMYFFSRIIPTAAMPIFFRIAGIDLQMYVAMIAFGSMPLVTLTVSSYVKEFPEELRFKAYTLGASHFEIISTAILPYVLPKVLDLAIIMIGPALVYLIAAEQIVAGEGFGYRIRVLTKATRFEVVYALIVILTIYAGMITFALKTLQKKLCPWYCRVRR